ncbi:hypothetical protein JTB14_026288 [Gonioctena quinquepunctata]|nr:hypothetical protein JTB14_026288 [Gonioctena quinquepunctata]
MVFTINYVFVVFLGMVMCAPPIKKSDKVYCSEIPSLVLEEILGAAYNARYMSIDEPVIHSSDQNGKRMTTGDDLDFSVDSEFSETIEDQPAWAITNHVVETLGEYDHKRYVEKERYRRSSDYKQEWHCKSRIKWIDLGPDYFPRYLRSVECLADKCWFDIYKCKPRSFTVKILRRRRNRCVTAAPGTKIGMAGLPNSLKELWVWEERAVSFCCDCSM